MDVTSKMIGIGAILAGFVLWAIDYLVFTAIGALTAWIAEAVGITGMAVLGVQVVGWILTLGIMVLLLVFGLYLIIAGLGLLFE